MTKLERGASARNLTQGVTDKVLIDSFRDLGALPATWGSNDADLGQLKAEDLVRCVGMALRAVRGAEAVPDDAVRLEGNLMQRHRVCANLASAVKALGYTRECGYNTLLYPSDERATRDLLGFLADLCAKADDAQQECAVSRTSSRAHDRSGSFAPPSSREPLETRISRSLQTWTAQRWTLGGPRPRPPPFMTLDQPEMYSVPLREAFGHAVRKGLGQNSEPRGFTHAEVCTLIERTRLEALRARLQEQYGVVLPNPRLSKAPGLHGGQENEPVMELAPSPDRRETKLASPPVPPRPSAKARPGASAKAESTAPTDAASGPGEEPRGVEHVAEEVSPSKAERTAVARAALRAHESALAALAQETDEYLRRTRDTVAAVEEARGLEADFAEQVALQREILEALPACPGNLPELEAKVESALGAERVTAKERAREQDVLAAELAALKEQREAAARRVEDRAQTASRLSAEIRELERALRAQREHISVLQRDEASLPDTNERSVYVSRIMDIVDQVRRQSAEIAKVISDVRTVQGEISQASEKLRRAEAVTDELVFGISESTPGDPTGARAYKLLHDMRVLFDDLIEIARRTGKAANRARDMDARAANLRSKVSATQMEQVRSDLAAMRAENERLASSHAGAST